MKKLLIGLVFGLVSVLLASSSFAGFSTEQLVLDLNMGNNTGVAGGDVYDSSGNGHTFTGAGSIPMVQGKDGYVSNDNSAGTYLTNTDGNIFASLNRTIAIKFRPEFEADANDNYVLYDSLAPRHSVDKLNNANNNVLRIYFGNTLVKDIPLADYQGSWNVGEDNILLITTTGNADTMNVWLNDKQVVTNSNTAFTPTGEGALVTCGSATQGWDGRIYYIKVWSRILSTPEVTELLSDRVTNISTTETTNLTPTTSRDGLLLDLNMGNNNGTDTVYDTSGRGLNFVETGAGGIIFAEGKDGYIEGNNTTGDYMDNTTGGIYGTATISIAFKFTPDFAVDANDTYVFSNSSTSRYFFAKLPNVNANVIRMQFANTVGFDIPQSNYESSWKINEENILIIRSNSAGGTDQTTAYLNGNLVLSTDGSWIPGADTAMTVCGQVNQALSGKMHYYKMWKRIITDAEVAYLSANRSTYVD